MEGKFPEGRCTYHPDYLQLPCLPVPTMAIGVDEFVILPFVVRKAAKRDEPTHVDDAVFLSSRSLSGFEYDFRMWENEAPGR